MQDKASTSLREAFELACNQLSQMIKNGVADEQIRLLQALSSITRNYISARNGEVSRDHLAFKVNRVVTVDQKELAEIIKKSLPEYVAK